MLIFSWRGSNSKPQLRTVTSFGNGKLPPLAKFVNSVLFVDCPFFGGQNFRTSNVIKLKFLMTVCVSFFEFS